MRQRLLRTLANALELAKRAVDLQAIAEVLGGLRIETVAAEAANVRKSNERGQSNEQRASKSNGC